MEETIENEYKTLRFRFFARFFFVTTLSPLFLSVDSVVEGPFVDFQWKIGPVMQRSQRCKRVSLSISFVTGTIIVHLFAIFAYEYISNMIIIKIKDKIVRLA